MVQDGRRIRRQRNIDAVHRAILELLEECETPTMAEVARRSGVTPRSIYRYHEDLPSAIDAARTRRVEELGAHRASYGPIAVDAPFADRVDVIVGRRIELEALGRPLRNVAPDPSHLASLDAESCGVFDAELAALPHEVRPIAASAVCHVLRPHAIRSLVEPDGDRLRTSSTLSLLLFRVFGRDPAGVRPGGV